MSPASPASSALSWRRFFWYSVKVPGAPGKTVASTTGVPAKSANRIDQNAAIRIPSSEAAIARISTAATA